MERDSDTKIFKYPIRITDEFTIKMPCGAQILHVGMQFPVAEVVAPIDDFRNGTPCIWAKVSTVAPDEERTFYVVGTGNPFPVDAGRHLGTFQQGQFIWHVFAKDQA